MTSILRAVCSLECYPTRNQTCHRVCTETEEGDEELSPETAASGFSFPSLVDEIRRSGITTSEIGSITGVRERQVQNWAAGSSRPASETRDRLVDVHFIVRQLQQVYRPEGIEIWIHSRNPELEGRRPIEMLVDGDFEPVVNAVLRLKAGAT